LLKTSYVSAFCKAPYCPDMNYCEKIIREIKKKYQSLCNGNSK